MSCSPPPGTVRKRLDLTRPVPPGLVQRVPGDRAAGADRRARARAGTGSWSPIANSCARRIGDVYRRAAEPYLQPARAGRRNLVAGGTGSAAPAQRRVGEQRRTWPGERMGQVPVHGDPVHHSARTGLASPGGQRRPGCGGRCSPPRGATCWPARARGLGTAWTTLHLHYETEVADAARLCPPGVRQAALDSHRLLHRRHLPPRRAPAAGGRAPRRSLVADLREPYAPGTTGNPPQARPRSRQVTVTAAMVEPSRHRNSR